MKINIVLLPVCQKATNALFQLAQDAILDSDLTTRYLLEDGRSYPHITIMQFELECSKTSDKLFEVDIQTIISDIWEITLSIWHETLVQEPDQLMQLTCQLPDKKSTCHNI